MAFLRPDSRRFLAGLAAAVLVLASVARAAAFGFSDGLSADEKSACGLAKLTAPQVAALNAMVDRDMNLAHEGGVTGFSSAFTARLSPAQRVLAGLERLTDKERGFLDTMAARTIAMGPPPSQAFAFRASAPVPVPVPPDETVVSAPPALQVHGDLSFTIGAGGHGSNFYGTAMDVLVTDPSGKFTLGVGVSEYRGRGFFGPYSPFCLDPPIPGW
jgi:hypothetical protein